MPSVSIYHQPAAREHLLPCLAPLRDFIAQHLSGEARVLTPEEVSIRLVEIRDGLMLTSVELEVTAHAYPERVKKQDEICRAISGFITAQNPTLGTPHVWLLLCELGHSWTE